MQEILPQVYRVSKRLRVVPFVYLGAAMHAVRAGDETILIDPFELEQTDTDQLESLGQPNWIVITGSFHTRDAEAYRSRYGAKILAHEDAVPKLDLTADETFEDADPLPGELRSVGMPGTIPGETIIHHPSNKLLITGDALMNIPPEERAFMQRLLRTPKNLGPMPALFMKDKVRASESYRRLLDLDFSSLCVSHGHPILEDAKAKLEAVLG